MKPLLYMVKGVRILRTSTAPFGDTTGKPVIFEACSWNPKLTLLG